MTQYVYNQKKDNYFSPSGEKVPRTQRVTLQELEIGTILIVTDYSYNGHASGAMKSVTVTAIDEEPKSERPKIGWGDGYGKPVSYRTFKVTTVDGKGLVEVRTNVRKKETGIFDRQCSDATAKKEEELAEIIGYRGVVRTLLGSAESGMGERPRKKVLQPYWDELQKVVDILTVLERRMTVDGGRDPEKDKRKGTNHRGQARRR